MAKKVEDNATKENVTPLKQEKTQETIKETTVYCGPAIKGVLQQYAHFTNGLPKHAKEYLKGNKNVKRLVVPMSRFIETNKNINVPGTIEFLAYQKILRGEL